MDGKLNGQISKVHSQDGRVVPVVPAGNAGRGMGRDVPRDDAWRCTDRWHRVRWAAIGSAALLAWFATAMAMPRDRDSPLDYSVFSASAVRCCLH